MILKYFKGIGTIILIALLFIAAILFFFVFDFIYAAVITVIIIFAILVFPYFMGKDYEKEKKGSYKLKKIK